MAQLPPGPPASDSPAATAPTRAPVLIRPVKADLALGDALVVEVIPHDSAAIIDAEELEFWLLRDGAGARRIWPVAPPAGVPLPPPAPGARKLVFTRATLEPGEYRLAASCPAPARGGRQAMHKAWTAAEGLRVAATAGLERDGLGLITRPEAERIAREGAFAPPGAPCASRLLDSPLGLKVWEVRLKAEGPTTKTIFVNPYLGSIHTMPISEEEKVSG